MTKFHAPQLLHVNSIIRRLCTIPQWRDLFIWNIYLFHYWRVDMSWKIVLQPRLKSCSNIRLHLFNRAEAQSWLLLDSTSQMMEIGKKKKRAKGAQQLTGKSSCPSSQFRSHLGPPLIPICRPTSPLSWSNRRNLQTLHCGQEVYEYGRFWGVWPIRWKYTELVADYPEYRKLCTYQMKTLPLKRACPACAQWSMTVSWLSRWRYVIRSFRQSWMLGA